jgi:hypothetical protein
MTVAARGFTFSPFVGLWAPLSRRTNPVDLWVIPSRGLGCSTERNAFRSSSPVLLHLTVKLACALPHYIVNLITIIARSESSLRSLRITHLPPAH